MQNENTKQFLLHIKEYWQIIAFAVFLLGFITFSFYTQLNGFSFIIPDIQLIVGLGLLSILFLIFPTWILYSKPPIYFFPIEAFIPVLALFFAIDGLSLSYINNYPLLINVFTVLMIIIYYFEYVDINERSTLIKKSRELMQNKLTNINAKHIENEEIDEDITRQINDLQLSIDSNKPDIISMENRLKKLKQLILFISIVAIIYTLLFMSWIYYIAWLIGLLFLYHSTKTENRKKIIIFSTLYILSAITIISYTVGTYGFSTANLKKYNFECELDNNKSIKGILIYKDGNNYYVKSNNKNLIIEANNITAPVSLTEYDNHQKRLLDYIVESYKIIKSGFIN